MDTPEPIPATKGAPDLDVEKKRLECVKLQAETDALRKSAFRTPQFYAALGPVIFLILGFLISWGNGWFDVKSKEIQNKIDALEVKRTKLEFDTLRQEEESTRVAGELQRLRTRELELAATVKIQEGELAELGSARTMLQEQLKTLAGADEKAVAFAGQLAALQADRSELSGKLEAAHARIELFRSFCAKQQDAITVLDFAVTEADAFANGAKARFRRLNDLNVYLFEVSFATTPFKRHWQLSELSEDDRMKSALANVKGLDELVERGWPHIKEAMDELRRQVGAPPDPAR